MKGENMFRYNLLLILISCFLISACCGGGDIDDDYYKRTYDCVLVLKDTTDIVMSVEYSVKKGITSTFLNFIYLDVPFICPTYVIVQTLKNKFSFQIQMKTEMRNHDEGPCGESASLVYLNPIISEIKGGNLEFIENKNKSGYYSKRIDSLIFTP